MNDCFPPYITRISLHVNGDDGESEESCKGINPGLHIDGRTYFIECADSQFDRIVRYICTSSKKIHRVDNMGLMGNSSLYTLEIILVKR